MNFPLFPALALPSYVFFGLSIFILLLGFFLSLVPHAGTNKVLTIFLFVTPTVVIAAISPDKEIFLITLAAYLVGLGMGSLIFYLVFIWQYKITNPIKYFSPADPYVITGTLGEKGYMISIRYQMATHEPFQKELPSNRTCIYFGNGNWVSVNNDDPSEIAYECTSGFGFFIQDINRKVTYNPSSFGSWGK